MGTFQYRVLGAVCLLGAVGAFIAFMALGEEAAHGGDGRPWWLLPLAIASLVVGVVLVTRRSVDLATLSTAELLRLALRQTVHQQVVVAVVMLLPLWVMLLAFGFFAPPGERLESTGGVVFAGLCWSLLTLGLGWIVRNIRNSRGERARRLVERLMTPGELATIAYTTAQARGVAASRVGSITIHFTRGDTHALQCPDASARRVAAALQAQIDRDQSARMTNHAPT